MLDKQKTLEGIDQILHEEIGFNNDDELANLDKAKKRLYDYMQSLTRWTELRARMDALEEALENTFWHVDDSRANIEKLLAETEGMIETLRKASAPLSPNTDSNE